MIASPPLVGIHPPVVLRTCYCPVRASSALSPAFAQVPELKSRRRELLAHLRAIEDEQE